MDVVFSSKNGFCPEFIYKKTKFYIKDRKQGGNYVYFLCSWNLEFKTITFDTHKLVLEHVRSIKNVKCKYNNDHEEILYSDIAKDYIIKKNVLTIRESYKVLTGEFDSYLSCLEYSKKYVSGVVDQIEPKQLNLV